jgi:mRNA interferase MazF
MARGDIVLVNLPQPASGTGHEQFGTRPALIIHDDTTSAILSVISIIPFTSNLNSQQFPHTILVQPSLSNGLNSPSVLLVFQLRAIDRKRIGRTLGRLEAEIIEQVNAEMRKMLGL